MSAKFVATYLDPSQGKHKPPKGPFAAHICLSANELGKFLKSLDCDNSNVGTNLLFHKFSMATGSDNEDQVSDELMKSWQLKMSWFQTLACPSHGFGSREPSGYFVGF